MDFYIPQRTQLQIRSEMIHFSALLIKVVAQLDIHVEEIFPRLLPYCTQINSRLET